MQHTISGVRESATQFQLYKLINLRDKGAALPAKVIEALAGATIAQMKENYDELSEKIGISKAEASGYIKAGVKALPNIEEAVFLGISEGTEAAFAAEANGDRAKRYNLLVIGHRLGIGTFRTVTVEGEKRRATIIPLPHIPDDAQMKAFARTVRDVVSDKVGAESVMVSVA